MTFSSLLETAENNKDAFLVCDYALGKEVILSPKDWKVRAIS